MERVIRAMVPIGVLVMAGACVTGSSGLESSASDRGASAVHAEVENHNWADVKVFAVRFGEVRRLGMVTSMSTGRFRIPRSWVAAATPVRIRVESIGSRAAFLSEDLHLPPGSVLRLTVENQLGLSSLMIR